MKETSPKLWNYIELALCIFIWGCSSLLVIGFKKIPSVYAASIVVLISCLVQSLYVLFFNRGIFQKFKTLSLYDNFRILFMSSLGFFLYPICYFSCLHKNVPGSYNFI